NPPVVKVTPDADPAQNNWNLGSGDPAPAGATNQGFGAEARWSADALVAGGVITPGHAYRVEFMVHDGDQNKTGGDTGENCAIMSLGSPVPCGSILLFAPPTETYPMTPASGSPQMGSDK